MTLEQLFKESIETNKALTQAVNTLTERFGKWSETASTQPTPPAETKPVEAKKVEQKPTEAANDDSYDLKAVQDLAVELAKDRQPELIKLLEQYNVKRVSHLEESQFAEFAAAIQTLLNEAA